MAEPLPLTAVAGALGLTTHARNHVALVGGGGKTTIAFAIAGGLAGSVVVTSTTRMGAGQHGGWPVLLAPSDAELRAAAAASPVVAWERVAGAKAVGVEPARCDRWSVLVDHVIVEADGSRGHPFKAPGPLEPVVPATATLLLSVIGAGALGRVIGDRCHRPLRVAALAGCGPYDRLTPGRAAQVLLHERGARRELPDGARFAMVVNQVDERSRGQVDDLIGSLAEREPAVTVLAVAFEEAIGPLSSPP